jgi:hypothetical protein
MFRKGRKICTWILNPKEVEKLGERIDAESEAGLVR